MTDDRDSALAYFISITRSREDDAIQYLAKHNWRLDRSLNLFFEDRYKRAQSKVYSHSINGPYQQFSTKPIIIPTMIEFQRFIESFHTTAGNLLENASKMMNLAMKYATSRPSNIAADQAEHWRIHLKVDYTRLQTLLDNDMCAPLVWIEHFEHLLDGNVCQLFDCDYMFHITD